MFGRILRVSIALLAAVALAMPVVPAHAAEGDSVVDADDVDGSLDLSLLKFFKSGNSSPMVITVKTHDPWKRRVLRDNVNKLVVLLDVDQDGSRDYQARIRKVKKALVVFIKGSGSNFEPLKARKPDGRTVKFTIPGNSPPNPSGAAPDMKAYSRFIEVHACDPGSGNPACVDKAPGGGWL